MINSQEISAAFIQNRKEHIEHYLHHVPCMYSLCVELDITALLTAVKKQKIPFYPMMIHAITTCCNRLPAFRMFLNAEGKPACYEMVHPSYTIFHPETETFSSLWTEFDEDWKQFLQNYQQDQERYGSCSAFSPKSNSVKPPENCINISCLPWVPFTGFHLQIPAEPPYLLPIFTFGKYHESEIQAGKMLLPLSIQVHHAACDGFHVGKWIECLQHYLDQMASQLQPEKL